MARDETITCDICGSATPRVVLKLFMSSVKRVSRGRSPHSDYTHHLDVGICCSNKVETQFSWHKRLSAEEYAEKRRVKAKG